jgi:hypothetical protein
MVSALMIRTRRTSSTAAKRYTFLDEVTARPCHRRPHADAGQATRLGRVFMLPTIRNASDAEYFRCVLTGFVINEAIDFCGL